MHYSIFFIWRMKIPWNQTIWGEAIIVHLCLQVDQSNSNWKNCVDKNPNLNNNWINYKLTSDESIKPQKTNLASSTKITHLFLQRQFGIELPSTTSAIELIYFFIFIHILHRWLPVATSIIFIVYLCVK